MTDRIAQYLEGTLDRDALDAAERVEADAAASAVSAARRFMAARAAPDVTSTVMRRLDLLSRTGSPRGRFGALWQSLWAPRQVSIRPAYAVVAAGACVALLLVALPSGLPSGMFEQPGADATPRLLVQFRLQTDAMEVQLAGSFTNWEPAHQMHQVAPGVWTITVALPQGVHDYAFVVDGQRWIPDPYAPSINDGFGGLNSRLTLLLPETGRT